MDLGFGSSNQALGEATASALLMARKAQEDQIDAQISQYDQILNLKKNSDDIEALREKRLASLKKQQLLKTKWRQNGHGQYDEIGCGQHMADITKEFFEYSKKSQRLVIHFYRPESRDLCDIVHKHLEILAGSHLETRFLKINVDSNGSTDYLVEKLGIVIMPTILIVKDRKAVHHIRGFDELGGTKDFSTRDLKRVLIYHGAIFDNGDNDEVDDEGSSSFSGYKGVNNIQITGRVDAPGNRTTVRNGGFQKTVFDYEDEDDSDFE